MGLISTKELFQIWQVSASRIVCLAKAGQIPGAKLIGNSWVFPLDTQKPSDNRRKENRSKKDPSAFRFPLYFYCPYATEEIENSFSDDERSPYNAEQIFLSGEFKKCNNALILLNNTTYDSYIRFGALYYLCLSSIYLYRCEAAFNYFSEITLLYSNETLQKKNWNSLYMILKPIF